MLAPSRGLSDTAGGIPRNCLKDALRPQKPYILDRIWRNGAARWNAAPQGRIDSKRNPFLSRSHFGNAGNAGAAPGPGVNGPLPNMSRALSRDKFGQTPCFSGPGLIIWPASLPRWTCLDRRASSQSNIRGFAGRAAAASDRRGSPPRALYVAGVASQFVATAGGVTFGLKSLPAGVPREQRPRE